MFSMRQIGSGYRLVRVKLLTSPNGDRLPFDMESLLDRVDDELTELYQLSGVSVTCIRFHVEKECRSVPSSAPRAANAFNTMFNSMRNAAGSFKVSAPDVTSWLKADSNKGKVLYISAKQYVRPSCPAHRYLLELSKPRSVLDWPWRKAVGSLAAVDLPQWSVSL